VQRKRGGALSISFGAGAADSADSSNRKGEVKSVEMMVARKRGGLVRSTGEEPREPQLRLKKKRNGSYVKNSYPR